MHGQRARMWNLSMDSGSICSGGSDQALLVQWAIVVTQHMIYDTFGAALFTIKSPYK